MNADSMHKIGVDAETVALLKAHSTGKDLVILESPAHHGGYVLFVTPEEYARIAAFATEEYLLDSSRPGEGGIHKSRIHLAVRKAFS